MEILVNILLIYLVISVLLNISTRYKKISFYINVIIFTIITGTVYEKIGGGGDYDNYRNMFNGIYSVNIPDKELGFYYLNLFIKNFTDDYSIAFFIFIFIINLLIIGFIYRYSKNIELSLIIYIIMAGYTTSINITRQYIAIAIYTYSIRYLLEKKYLKYIFMGFLAFQFHVTVLIPIILTIIVKIFNEKITKNYIIYFLLINSIIIIEPIIRKIIIDIFFDSYENGMFFYGSNIFHYIVQLAFVVFYSINIKKINNYKTKLVINLSTITSAFILLSKSSVLYARIALYFNIFNAIAIVNIISENKNVKEKRVIYYCISIGLLIYYVLLTRKVFILESYIIEYLKDFFISVS